MIKLLIVDDNESIHNDFKKVLQGKSKDKLRNVEVYCVLQALFHRRRQVDVPLDATALQTFNINHITFIDHLLSIFHLHHCPLLHDLMQLYV